MAETTTDEQLAAISESVADGMAEVTVDGQTVKVASLRDRIEAAKFLASQQQPSRRRTVRLIRCIPPGAV